MRSRAITEEPNAHEIMKGEEWEEGDAGIDSEGGLGGIPGIRDGISDWLNLQCDTWAWRIRLADAELLYI